MFAASTPLNPRKRKALMDDCLILGISPINSRGAECEKPRCLPKLPRGTTLEVLRGPPNKVRPLAENLNMGNIPSSIMVEAQTRKSLAYLNGIIAPPRRKPPHAQAPRPSKAPDGLNAVLMSVDKNSKKNMSQFPELVVISDEDDEEPERKVQLKTRKSVATGRKTIAVGSNVYDFPTARGFRKMSTKPVAGSRSSMYTNGASMLPVFNENGGDNAGYSHENHTTIIKSEPQDVKMTRKIRSSRASAIVKSEKLSDVPENVFQPTHMNNDAYEFSSESERLSEPEISKFSMADVDVWKEMKSQMGIFFSKAPSPQSSGQDGEAFPARAGYLRMEAKKTLDIQSCANNVVFTVVKGKGRVKNKTEMKNSNAKTEMIVGDILTVPQGSTFVFTNLGTKNDLIMSYVKLS